VRTRPTYRRVKTLVAGEDDPQVVIVPKGVVHAYQNIGDKTASSSTAQTDSIKAIDAPSEIDEIRHEDNPDTIFRMD
jgi:dTDP-4-dehydrorhamnose 3,5-epimerase